MSAKPEQNAGIRTSDRRPDADESVCGEALRIAAREAVMAGLEHDLRERYLRSGEPAEAAERAVSAVRASNPGPREALLIAKVLCKTAEEGGTLAGLPEFCAELFSHVRIAEQLSQSSLNAAVQSYRQLFSENPSAQARGAHFPQVAATALNREALRRAPGGEAISVLGDILAHLPMEGPQRSIRDLLVLMDDRCRLEDLRLLRDLLASEQVPDGLTMAFRIFTGAMSHLRSQRPGAWEECRDMATKALANGFKGARACIRSFEELVAANVSPLAVKCFATAMPELARERPDILHGRVAASVARGWMVAPPPPSACRSFLSQDNRRPLEPTTVRLARLTGTSFERIPFDEIFWPALESLSGLGHFRPLAPERHELHRRIADLHRGFSTSLRFDLKRLPGETVSPLIRAGIEVGDVQLVHSATQDGFPGSGVSLSNLALSKILASDDLCPEDPFRRYKNLWPGIAKELEKLSSIGLVVTEGMLIVQPPSSMRLVIGRRQARHYSLCIFAGDPRDHSLVKALLVESEWLRRRVAPCLKEWRPNWFKGAPEQSAQDIGSMSLRPEQILARNTSRDIIAIDVGSPLTHLAGFAYGLAPGTTPLFGHPTSRPESVPLTTFGHVVVGAADAPLHQRRAAFRAQARVDIDLARYLSETLNHVDAFRLCHAILHKGLGGRHGAGADYSIKARRPGVEPPSLPEIAPGSSLSQPTPAQVALGPLVDALKWHRALSADGHEPGPNDPMLVTTSALTYSQPPDGEFVLDLRTLECRVDTFRFALFPGGRPRLTADVKRIWLEELLPRFSDTFQDLRVVSRDQLQRTMPGGRPASERP